MTNQDVRELIADLAAEVHRELRSVGELIQRNAEERRKTEEMMRRNAKKTDRQLKNLGQQIGGLGHKFGGFAEGMALPSMSKILNERFGMEHVGPRATYKKNGQTMEFDVLAYSTEKKEVVVVEVKSKLTDEHIDTMKARLRQVPSFIQELRGMKVYGILAVVTSFEKDEIRVLSEGLYLAKIHDETFELHVPEDFTPRDFGS